MDLHRLLRSLSLLIFILATYFSNAEARQHRHNHGRQRDKRFQEPPYFVLDGGSGPDRGPWGPWTEEGPCSRTCGGGVTYQTRSCTGGFCEGPSRRYFSCNIQDCPEGSHDFRGEQCAAFNTEPFDDVYYDWIPYTKAPNKCELNCMPRGERFYYRHRDKVVDGTRCEEEKLDVCVEGKCLPVGCDMMLGSPVREDKCRECGGDNSGCTTASGILENEDLQVGYNDILLIPAGATNIRIREVKASNNYLAIRNVTGHYYLNGNWRIDFPRSLRFAGTVFHYERKPHAFFAPETITSLGPTTEALYIVLLYQEHNPGVEYEYSIPKGLVQETDPDSYVWVSGDFGPCSATCGGGIQQRKVWCAKRKDLSEVSPDLCDSALVLSTEGTCANEPCSPQWALGEWAPCSQTCGPGSVKIRQVICEQIVSNGRPSLVDNSACEELLGPSPPTKEECSDVPCPKWHIGPWLPCDKLCGEGKQRRKVRCFTKNDGRIEVLGDSACPVDKPQTEMSCQLKPCEGLDWIVSDWSGCDEKCGLSFETREAHCATQKGQVYPDSFCHKYRVPPLIRECENPPACQHEWYASQWSECSVKCGTGVQTRKVFCGTFEGESIKKVDDSKCDIEQKYEDTKNCTGKEVCKGHWFTGPWSACSKPCGGGTMSRKVLCLLENKTVDATNCDPHLVAFSSEACNNHACGADEIVPVEPTHPITEEEEDVCEDDDYDDSDDGSALLARLEDDSTKKFDLVESITFSSSSDTGETSSFETSSFEPSKGTDISSSILSSVDYSGSPSDMMMSDYTYSPIDTDPSAVSSSVGSTEESASSTTEESETGSTDSTEESSPSSESSTLISSETTESSIFELISSTVSLGLSSLSSSLASSTDSSTDVSSTEVSSTDSSSGTSDVSATDLSSSVETVTASSSLETSDTTITDITSSSLSTDSTVTDSTETSSESSSSSTVESSTFQFQTISSSESSSMSTSESSSESSPSSVGLSSSSSEILSSTVETTSEMESSSITSESSTSFSSSESTSSSDDLSTTEESTDEPSTSFDSTLSTEELSSSSLSPSSSSPSPSSVETTESVSSSSQYASSTSESSSSPSSTDESSLSSLSTTTSYTDTATTVSYATDIWSTSQSTVDIAVTKEQKPKKCKRKKKKPKSKEPKCITSEFGCCSDNSTEAQGPFNKGCPQPTTCKETKFGCCSDGVSPALGEDNEGCPSSHCNETLFGCCPDGVSIAEGNDNEGCPVEEVTLPFDCKTTQFGCCPDGIAPASGPNFSGCFECEGSGECDTCTDTKYGCCPDGISAAAGPDNAGCEPVTTEGFITVKDETTETGEDCSNSTYGCCPDGLTPAAGEDDEGCPVTEAPVDKGCGKSQFGCCPDGNTTATGPNNAGCPSVCPDSPYGCCDDNETPAHGPNKEGCCLNTAYGCCPDNIKAALGPNLEGCGCHYSTYGCCPDNNTVARGPNNEGCGCQYTEHGCCPNKYTPAAGPNFQGCPCHTHQFGCCPDGVTRAKGPHLQGCGCENTEFGCCPDNHTPASGPDRNCTCEASLYGCCPDGETEAAGEHFEGCAEIPLTAGEQCTQPKDRGPCRDFTVKWFFDTEYGGCARFWYGGCGGNENRFRSQEECASTCVELKGREACTLPKIEGPCEGYYPTWYYDTERKQCGQFIYGGCLGNSNNFETREACHELCIKPDTLDACEQSVEKGVCQGNFTRWYYDRESKSCQEFTYGGCKPNGNNFLTELACQQKCLHPGRSRDECSLPRAQGSCSERLPRWFFDASENRCMPFYYSGCEGNGNSFETQEFCETACPAKVEQDTCSLPVVPGDCHNYTEQWYYDVYLERCRPFYYGGCGGNQNRFNKEIDCQRRCDRTYISLPSATPVTFTTDMCFLPIDKGPCSQSEALWYYDSHNGVCAQFIYGGCEGNANRFESRQECEHRCGEAQDICNLPKVVGPCSGNYQQWYYDPNTDSCHVFDYGGCQGNSNRFNTMAECEGKCRKSFPPPQEVLSTAGPPTPVSKSSICYTPVEAGPCRAQIPAWYFNSDTGRCQLFIYGGCQGNANRFDSEEQCERHCGQFQGLDVCRFPVDVGPCLQNLRKWYFDADSQTCQEFNYGGCLGSANRFSSVEECDSVCLHREEIFPSDNTTAISHIAVCKLPVDAGPCQDGYYKRWFFNEAHRTCEQFEYGGCAGNLNRFKSFQICIEFCASLAGTNEIDDNKEECADIELACSRALHCEFGIERWVDEKGCENCRCHNPCITSDPHCPPNTTCSVEMQKNEVTGDIEYHAVCRPVSKDGECPQILDFRSQSECSEDCKSDADCPGDAKCCYNGCGMSCIRPQMPVTSAPTTQGPPPDTFNVPGASAPQIEETEPQTEGEEGDMVTLRCVVHGTPTPVITWYKGDQKLGLTGGRYRFLSDGTVQIIGLYRADAGVYVCIANNSIGPPVRREFIVVVKVPVKTNISLEETTFPVSSDISIPCDVDGYPVPHVTWFKDESPLEINERVHITESSRLLIVQANTNDTGIYRCHAENAYSSADSSISISVQGVYIHPNCTDNPFFANCNLIVKAQYCTHTYYARFCCKSCTQAGQLPPLGPHLGSGSSDSFSSPNNLFRRRRSLVNSRL